jgi:hypothetical protein
MWSVLIHVVALAATMALSITGAQHSSGEPGEQQTTAPQDARSADAANAAGRQNRAVRSFPRIPLGEPIQRFQKTMGRPIEHDGKFWTWRIEQGRLMITTDDAGRIASYTVSWGPGRRPILTPDGVLLGQDTLIQVRSKLAGRILNELEDFGMIEGVWFLHVYSSSPTGDSTVSDYSWYLNEGIPQEAAIIASDPSPHSAEVFRNVVVHQYSVETIASRARRTGK